MTAVSQICFRQSMSSSCSGKPQSKLVQNELDPRLKALQNMDAEALAALGGLINAIKEAKADGCEPGTVFAWVEEDLRARMAVPVKGPSIPEYDPQDEI